MIVLGVLILLFLIYASVWIYLAHKKNIEFLKNIPGPKPIPLFGNLFEGKSTKDVLYKFSKEYNGLFKVYLGPVRKVIITADYKFTEAILSSTTVVNKADQYDYFKPWLGLGVFTSNGLNHKRLRKVVTPTLHFKILEQFVEVFEDAGNQLVKKLKDKVGLSSVDIYPFVALCTLDIICESAMGTSINAQLNNNSDYVQSVTTMCKIAYERMGYLLQILDITFPLTKNYYLQKKALAVLHKKTNEVVWKRRQALEQKKREELPDNTDDCVYGKPKKRFLDLLLEANIDGKPLTHQEIREQVDTFMFGGSDTIASAVSFALYCLANNGDVQEKAYEEQLLLFGNNKNPAVTYANLQDMKYLELVIKETLRLYPSIPLWGRKTTEPVELDNYVIPKGITITVFAFAIHRDPKYYKDPEKFDPSRFDNVDGKYPYAYIPFSAGPRNCIGQRFAMLEMKSLISKIIRNFQLHPASPEFKLQLLAESVLKSSNGIKIAFSIRE